MVIGGQTPKIPFSDTAVFDTTVSLKMKNGACPHFFTTETACGMSPAPGAGSDGARRVRTSQLVRRAARHRQPLRGRHSPADAEAASADTEQRAEERTEVA